ncbi:hypothetical protein FNV43_RR12773 [Rhamnella rubrinervis]|uniref:Response regulatory domain-containing protein n=1 Tax=Rhamnella rubrinervis TaxID=2594499 RepID=A0A8K0H7X7_9ROSA|nr:hypothetical protein FNV43_RR12773 [Rhamnella rubrinervis]
MPASDEIHAEEHGQSVISPTSSTKLRIMVVDDDATFLAIVSGLLKMLNHEVVTFRNPLHALSTLGAKKNYFDLVITDVHMPQIDGFEMQQRVQQHFKLPLIMISADDRESVMLKALERGVALYIVKPVSLNDLKNLWQYVVAAKNTNKPAHTTSHQSNKSVSSSSSSSPPLLQPPSSSAEKVISSDESINNKTASISSANNTRSTTHHHHHKYSSKVSAKRKRSHGKELLQQQHDVHRDSSARVRKTTTTITNGARKAKVIWTNALQTRFLEAINYIGLERSVPKKILEAMNVQGLTRENVASHLQEGSRTEVYRGMKYRLFLKKVAERSARAANLSARSQFSNIGLNRSTALNSRCYGQHPRRASSQSRFRGNNMSVLNAPNLGLGRFNDHGASSSTSIPQFGNRQPNFLSSQANFQQPNFGPNPFREANFSSVNGVNAGSNFSVGGHRPYESVKATNGIMNNVANPMQINQQQTQKSLQIFTTDPLGYNFGGSSSVTPKANYSSSNYGKTGSLGGSHPVPNYSNIFAGTQKTSGGYAAPKDPLVPNGCGNSAGFNNSSSLMNSSYDTIMTAVQIGNRSFNCLPRREDVSSVDFPSANQLSPRLPEANKQDNTAVQPPLQQQQHDLFNNLEGNYIFNATKIPSQSTNMSDSKQFGGDDLSNPNLQQMSFQFCYQKQGGKEIQNSDYSQKQDIGKLMDIDLKGKSVVEDETPAENSFLDQACFSANFIHKITCIGLGSGVSRHIVQYQ